MDNRHINSSHGLCNLHYGIGYRMSRPYSNEFLLENQEKILKHATNGQMLELLEDLRAMLEHRDLRFNAGIVAEAKRRLDLFDRQFNNRSVP